MNRLGKAGNTGRAGSTLPAGCDAEALCGHCGTGHRSSVSHAVRFDGGFVRTRKPATRELYANLSSKHLDPEPFGAISLDKLRPSDAEALIPTLRDQLLARNVAAAIPRPGLARREAKHLTGEQVGAVLTAAASSRDCCAQQKVCWRALERRF
jgi:hypothetical protein